MNGFIFIYCYVSNRKLYIHLGISRYMWLNMVKNTETTTIKVSKETQQKLKDLKIHENQSYDEVIQKLLEKEKKQ